MGMKIMQIILDKIRAYDRILLFRHSRMDGDCAGATKGLKTMLKESFPDKVVLIPDDQHSDALAFMGTDDPLLPAEEYADALGIVLDTGTADRISNPNYRLCKELIKIDHHIPVDEYADYPWVEEWRSSASEMVVQLHARFPEVLKLTKEAATYLYIGMVTDSGQFRYRGVTGETMRMAGLLLDRGIDTDWICSNLYLRSVGDLKLEAWVYKEMAVTESGVASIYISRRTKAAFGLSDEAASAAVCYLENIKGCLCWLAFIENDDPENTIRVRLRSRYVAINPIAKKYHGGGHACACGATVYSREEMENLIGDADMLVKEYKETHEEWL